MTQEEYKNIDWNRGNVVRLTNGKEYSVRGTNKRYIILYSEEFQKHFVADFHIIDCRISDNIEPFIERLHPTEKHLKKEAALAAAKQAQSAPAPKPKPEPKPEVKAEEPAPTPEAAEQPAPEKRKRKRITVSRSERVQY